MSQSQARKFRRAVNKAIEPHLEQMATQEYIRSTFKPKPRWMPKFLWKKVVDLAIKH
jgi:hypothetical protein